MKAGTTMTPKPEAGHRSGGKVDRTDGGAGRAGPPRPKAESEALSRIPEQLRPFVVFQPWDIEALNVTEAAARLGVSRATVYDWLEKKKLLGWESTGRGRTIPAEQILEPGKVAPGIPQLLEIIPNPKLAWFFLSEECPFENDAMRPVDKLRAGEVEEVLGSAPSFGSDII